MRTYSFRWMHIAVPLAALAAGAVLACGGGGGGDSASDLSSATISSEPKLIDQDKLAFKPNELVVGVGEELTYTNSETAIHTVTINGKNESGTMRKDDKFLWKAPAPGEYKITCDFHAQMKATVLAR